MCDHCVTHRGRPVRTDTDATVDVASVTALWITRSPKKIIHPSNEAVTFTAHVSPSAVRDQVPFEWKIDSAPAVPGSITHTLTHTFTTSERRKTFTVAVTAGERTAEVQVRVASPNDTGIDVAPDRSNAGLAEFGWSDHRPVIFDTDDGGFQAWRDTYHLERPVQGPGRLQYSTHLTGSGIITALTKSHRNRPAGLVLLSPDAWNTDRPGMQCHLDHEEVHCRHLHEEASDTGSLWRELRTIGDAAQLAFTEMMAYVSNIENTSVNYRYYLQYEVLEGFRTNYNDARTHLASLAPGTNKDLATGLLNDARSRASRVFPELVFPPPLSQRLTTNADWTTYNVHIE